MDLVLKAVTRHCMYIRLPRPIPNFNLLFPPTDTHTSPSSWRLTPPSPSWRQVTWREAGHSGSTRSPRRAAMMRTWERPPDPATTPSTTTIKQRRGSQWALSVAGHISLGIRHRYLDLEHTALRRWVGEIGANERDNHLPTTEDLTRTAKRRQLNPYKSNTGPLSALFSGCYP